MCLGVFLSVCNDIPVRIKAAVHFEQHISAVCTVVCDVNVRFA